MSELYQKNIQLIQKRWPEIAQEIDSQNIEQLDAKLVEGNSQTISIDDIQLSSRHDPLEEALFYRSQTQGEKYYLFGCAMGDIPKLLMHDKQAKSIIIYLINPDVMKLVLHFTEQPWLEDERFCLRFMEENPVVRDALLAEDGAIILPSEKVLCKRHSPYLFYQFESANFFFHINKKMMDEEDAAFDAQRLKENVRILKKRKPVDKFTKNNYKKYPSAIVIGAGPTLEEQIDHLKEVMSRKHRPYIIAASMAGNTLYQHGIYPDAIINIDRGKGVGENNDGLTKFIPFQLAEKGTKFIVSTLTPTDIIQKWAGELYYANLVTPNYDECQKRLPTERLFIYGSVIASAVHIAASIATQRVYFMGMDFSFPDKKFHAGMDNNTHGNMTINEVVLNGYGEEVETSTSYRTFLTGVECLTHEFSALQFINCSRRGAKINNTTYLDEGVIV
ncbi:6-hydroxymethylpterin diphosphokinase MptE-like protein [Vibrio algivorus]|uniref:Motility associated factor glycosyltransferase family protein n=1 Tax=Vibrio algivorus TaxID=1667024 RepID=A0A557P4Y1_9VIBR|nr:6-hydroxymethylpterin diphosphokinase MptE-like protein [Vibrio algivorus]TVO35726.1 motility associated factor glycosyltransferase family protein [Vibrio algivorus]